MIFVGIDPGVSGALGVVSETGQALHAAPLPLIPWQGKKRIVDGTALTAIFRTLLEADSQVFQPRLFAILEHAQAFPKQGITGTFNYGAGFGVIWGILQALGISHQLERPRSWQKIMTTGLSGDPKDRARAAAARLWPAGNYHHDGIIDALLLAEFGRRTWRGESAAAVPATLDKALNNTPRIITVAGKPVFPKPYSSVHGQACLPEQAQPAEKEAFA